MPSGGTTTCVYRFAGMMPPAGFPLIVDDEDEETASAEIMGQRIRKRVSHIVESKLSSATESALILKLDEGYTLKELSRWAETVANVEDKTKLIATLSVATRLNEKSLVRSVLLPSKKVKFLGIVSPFQPAPATAAKYGLNHARVIVEGVAPVVNEHFTRGLGKAAATERIAEAAEGRNSIRVGGTIEVLGVEVGKILNGTHILSRSGISIHI